MGVSLFFSVIVAIPDGVYQLAMIPLMGWKKIEAVTTKNVHPESELSKGINISATSFPQNKEQVIYATLMLWKRSGDTWTDNELEPVTKKVYSPGEGKIIHSFTDGGKKTIEFDE